MKNALRITAVALCCVALVACSQKGPAEAALKAAEASVNEIKPEGAKYAPDQTKGVLTSFANAQDAFNKGDYKVAMEIAQGIPAKAKDVVAAIAAKKDQLKKTWNDLNAAVPPMVEQVKAKVDAWGAMKKLPKDVDAAKVDAAKASLADIEKSWAEASDASKSGNLTDAVAKGSAVKTKLAAEMVTIGIAPVAPETAPAPAAPPAPAPPKAKPATK
jgi:predicted small lipoprotein YifL